MTVLSQAETVLLALSSLIISQVKTIVGLIEIAISSIIFQNITLRTKQFYLVFFYYTDCQNLPISLSTPLSSILDLIILKILDYISTLYNSKTIEVLLIMRIVFCFTMMIVLLVLYFNSLNEMVLQCSCYLLLFLSLIIFVLFLVLAVIWLKVNSVVFRAIVDFKESSVLLKSIIIVVYTALSIIFNILYLILLYNNRFIQYRCYKLIIFKNNV